MFIVCKFISQFNFFYNPSTKQRLRLRNEEAGKSKRPPIHSKTKTTQLGSNKIKEIQEQKNSPGLKQRRKQWSNNSCAPTCDAEYELISIQDLHSLTNGSSSLKFDSDKWNSKKLPSNVGKKTFVRILIINLVFDSQINQWRIM